MILLDETLSRAFLADAPAGAEVELVLRQGDGATAVVALAEVVDVLATSDAALARVARSEGIEVMPLPDSGAAGRDGSAL